MTLVLIDFSVFIHQVHGNVLYLKGLGDEKVKGAIDADLAYLASGKWLEGLVPDGFQMVLLQDTKPYWRTNYLRDFDVYSRVPREGALEKKRLALLEDPDNEKLQKELTIHYKAGRKLPTYFFKKVKKRLKDGIGNTGLPSLSFKGYEADDLAATFCALNTTRDILLCTIDSDWMGLISPRVSWYCLHGYKPRLRSDMVTINNWAERRLSKALDTPRDIWETKAWLGDRADNIPPSQGLLLPVIDLLNPPVSKRLWAQPNKASVFKNHLDNPELCQIDHKLAKRAEEYLASIGAFTSIRPFMVKRDLIC